MEIEMEIEHFSHEHPLILKEKQIKDDDSNGDIEYSCAGCSEILALGGTYYSCNINGCNFTLHKKCAKLPREMHHPMHTDHVLTLLAKPPYVDAKGYCDNCKIKVYEELVKEEPRDFRPYLCQGIIYTLLSKKDEAEKQFQKYRRLVPKGHPYARYFDDNMIATKVLGQKFENERAASRS